ncbi:MAG: dCMP deaminase family protein [Nanoarchaeota archaeon]|nr:dCMP deaminase family protein [Nanoarchaeota archaeon]
MEIPDWDSYFMTMVYLLASRSKDKSAHIGAVVVGPQKEIRSTGYNGFPRGLNDNVPERYEKPEKFFWFVHAEKNAIYNASRNGVSLEGCVMYTNGIPCSRYGCASGIIQSGIKKVIVDKRWDDDKSEKWNEEAKRSLQMFSETGVDVGYYEGPFVELVKFHHGIRTPIITSNAS